MSLAIHHNPPVSDELGSAHFFADKAASTASRLIRVTATNPRYRSVSRPIDVSITGDDHRTSLALSLDEAEALIECLGRAVQLRYQAENRPDQAAAPALRATATRLAV